LGIRLSVSLLAQNESFSWRRTSNKYQLSLIYPAVESRSRQPALPLITRRDSSQQKSTIETGNAFSCIFRLSRQAAFAACKKANRSNLTSPRGPKASRRKTFDLSNRGQQTARRGNSRAGQFFLKVREKYGRESRQAQTLERAASTSATRIGHNCQFEYGDV